MLFGILTIKIIVSKDFYSYEAEISCHRFNYPAKNEEQRLKKKEILHAREEFLKWKLEKSIGLKKTRSI